jgi:mitochondrial protein MBA1
MYSAFAESDIPTLQKICADGILDSFRARIGNRAHGEKMLWELIRYNKRAKIVSHRAARLPIEGAGLRQAVVRIASRQKLSRYTANGALVKGTGKERDVVEYVVLEKKCWQGKEEDWRIWGTMEETKFETVMQWQRDALGA